MGTLNAVLGRLTYFDANIVIHVLEGFPDSQQSLSKILSADGPRRVSGGHK